MFETHRHPKKVERYLKVTSSGGNVNTTEIYIVRRYESFPTAVLLSTFNRVNCTHTTKASRKGLIVFKCFIIATSLLLQSRGGLLAPALR